MAGKARGSIPARAGETPPHSGHSCSFGVYPRTGGGNGQYGGELVSGERSIPARAGETGTPYIDLLPERVYPRTGGGNLVRNVDSVIGIGLSPHGRGKLRSPRR